ncbi:transposase [bacterium]|nr:transposase [bacterium]
MFLEPSRKSQQHPSKRPVPVSANDAILFWEQAYLSDFTDAEWAMLEPLIPQAKRGGRPEEWPKREIVNAILYILRSGCPWRMLPHDFPPYTTVYDYFRAWRDQGLRERSNSALSKRLRRHARSASESNGRHRR